MEHTKINHVEIAYEVTGKGEPVLFIHGALIADAMQPLAHHPAIGGYQRIRYHRRGLGSSGRLADEPASIAMQAADALGLLDHLGIEAAHLAGHSLGAAIALEIAATHPERARSLVLLEPGLVQAPSFGEFAEAVLPLAERHAAGDAEGAVHTFFSLIGDDRWRAAIESTVPGGVAQAVEDAASWYDHELPALAEWAFGPDEAARITCPALSVLGSASSPLFVEARELLHQWLTRCEDADIPGATHLLQMEAPDPVASVIGRFLTSVVHRPVAAR